MHRRQSTATVSDLTSVLSDEPGIDLVAVLPIVIASALQARSAVLVSRALKLAFEKVSSPPPDLAEKLSLALAFAQGQTAIALPRNAAKIESVLADCVHMGDMGAALILGRALCQIDAGALKSSALVSGQNMRRGAALLFRAADGGRDEAWMCLYSVSVRARHLELMRTAPEHRVHGGRDHDFREGSDDAARSLSARQRPDALPQPAPGGVVREARSRGLAVFSRRAATGAAATLRSGCSAAWAAA